MFERRRVYDAKAARSETVSANGRYAPVNGPQFYQAVAGCASRLCLADRQIHSGGEQRERDVGVPDPFVVAGLRERDAAEPRAEEAADLMRQQRQAEQRREIARAEQLADQAGRRRHRREPREAERAGEQIDVQRRLRHHDVDRDDRGTARVDQRQQDTSCDSADPASRADRLPATLNRPISMSELAATSGVRPHSCRSFGRCVTRNAM